MKWILIAHFTLSFTQWTSSSDGEGTFAGHTGGSLEVAQQCHVELRWQIQKPHPQDYMNLGKYDPSNVTHQNKQKAPYSSTSEPTIGHPMRTIKVPPMKKAVPFNLWAWKKW